jgi:predicted  nucleic acid-binding Zn-ribbon protein
LNLLKQLENTKTELNKLVVEKYQQSLFEKEQQSQFEQKIQEQNEKIASLMEAIEVNAKNHVKAMAELQAINDNLEKDNLALQKQLEEQVSSK